MSQKAVRFAQLTNLQTVIQSKHTHDAKATQQTFTNMY